MDEKGLLNKDKNNPKLPSLTHDPAERLKPSSVGHPKKTTI